MGMPTAFSPLADFSAMTTAQVCISQVLHKAKIKVDETGSEAAAVTDVTMKETSAGPGSEPKVFTFHADHPFIYAITEVSTGAIFFIGQYSGK
jgi:serpin B